MLARPTTARRAFGVVPLQVLPHLSSLQVPTRPYSVAPSPAPEASIVRAEGGLTFLELNRASAKNALSVSLVDSLRQLVEEVRFDGSTRALILRSAVPGAFCAGADLKERKAMSQLDVARFLYNLRRLLGELQDLPVPTVAAVDGPALGGGLELALACDFRVAGSSVTKLGLPETRLAIIPGAGGTQRLSRLIGTSRAKDLIFRAKVMDAHEALQLGIVNYVSDQGQSASDKAEEVVREMLQAGPLALRAAKVAIDVGVEADLESGLDVERLAYQTILQTEDRLEGLRAFAEKRKPVYQGR
ncbi:ClpP/crotonase-like domain-containing protein [Rhodotorula diobovata]|uniref:ClpP/crotonase-like domain-containing protein n=1 Tax=Rhodotorula diobovata TaxID=5288 RepID=A0A5C5FSR3_9BASI|nr:ClpP/crotonase-like domain-containing protein [Rhodotorula diobovata]